MISKERLEELIEKEKIIYCKDSYFGKPYIREFKLCKVITIEDIGVKYENLFETKEEAEWEIEFRKVERTETLRLPTWEELQDDLKNCEIGDYVIADNYFITLIYYKGDFSPQIVLYTNLNNYNWNMSKENYIEACKLCKKVFLGERE